MLGPLWQTADHWPIDFHDLRNPYLEQWTIVVIWPILVLSLLSSHFHKLLVGSIVYRLHIWLPWIVAPSQFQWQVSESIAENDLNQNKWK